MDDSITGEGTTSCHVLAIPYPGRGHVNALMNACRLLASSNSALLITFVVTEEWLGLTNATPNLRLRTIPNVIPSEFVRGADQPGFAKAVHSKMEGPFEELLEGLEPPAGFMPTPCCPGLWSWGVEGRFLEHHFGRWQLRRFQWSCILIWSSQMVIFQLIFQLKSISKEEDPCKEKEKEEEEDPCNEEEDPCKEEENEEGKEEEDPCKEEEKEEEEEDPCKEEEEDPCNEEEDL